MHKEHNRKHKFSYKRGVALLLAAGMIMGLTACGKKEESAANAGGGASGSNTGGQTAVEVKGNYYAGEYETIPENNQVGKVAISGNSVYYLAYDEENDWAMKFMKYDTESKQVTEMPLSLGEGETIDNISVNSEGNLVCLKVNWEADGGVPMYYVDVFGTDGTLLMEKELTGLLEGQEVPYLYNVAVGKDDRICVAGGNMVWVLDKEGNMEFSVPIDTWISEMGTISGGQVAVIVYEGDRTVVKLLDLDKKGWGETYKSDSFGDSLYFAASDGDGIYFYDNKGLLTYDPEKEEARVVADWITNDIFADDIGAIRVKEDGSLQMVFFDSSGSSRKVEMALLKQIDARQAAEKQILTLGTIEIPEYGGGIRKGVIDFNKSNDKYRVEIIEYAEGTTYEEGVTRFKNEITAGNMPDIVNITDGTEGFYAAKGLLEDLKPYFDGDQGLNRADYFENLLTAMETGGKLYTITPEFYIDTLVGKTSNVGEGFGWTMEDMMKLEETRGEGVEMIDHETKARVLDVFLRYNLAQFFDLGNGLCDFDNEDFKAILEFANRFPKENEYSDTDASEWRKASEGGLLLMREGIMSVQDYQQSHNIFGEDISFVGFPSKFGCGSVAKCGQVNFGMSAKSANKDGVWEFIRFFLGEDYQTNSTSYFPLLRSAFDKKAQDAMKVTYTTDENGNKVETANLMIGTNDFTLEVFAAKEEEVEEIRELVGKLDHMERIDEQVMTIVTEEAGAYFDGQKSVQDVMSVIQSRANIYMNENK